MVVRDPSPQRRIDDLTRRVSFLESALSGNRSSVLGPQIRTRLARTVAHTDYPVEGNSSDLVHGRFPIEFLDSEFDPEPGWWQPTHKTRKSTDELYSVVAMMTKAGEWVESGTIVTAYQANPLEKDGEWFILPVAGTTTSSDDSGLVRLRNDTGTFAAKYQILAIGASLEDATTDLDAFLSLPHRFSGDYATDGTPGDWGNWAVLQEDIPSGEEGRAMVTGVTPIQIDQTGYEDLPFLDVQVSGQSFRAQSHWHGKATVLEASDLLLPNNIRWGITHLHEYRNPIYRATASGAISAGGSGTCAIQDDHGYTGDTDVTVANNWMEGAHAIASSDELLIRFNRDRNSWQIVSAEC